MKKTLLLMQSIVFDIEGENEVLFFNLLLLI